jgi:hypothetical protein
VVNQHLQWASYAAWIDTISDLSCMRTELPRYLAGPEHHSAIRGDLDGDQELLQRELDLYEGA